MLQANAKQKKYIKRILFLTVLAVVLLSALDVRLKVQKYVVSSPLLSHNIRIVLITDLHSCKYGNNSSTLIDAIDAQMPDLILFGGDIYDDTMPSDNADTLIQNIADRYPCYYVSGNHEYWCDDVNSIFESLQSMGVTILDGTYITEDVRGQKINICGISDPDAIGTDIDAQLTALEAAEENGYYTVLLAHRPEEIETYANHNFDLVLSGHAHGGQWRIPWILNGLYAPDQGIFPKYAGGIYTVEETTMIVSRGLARESNPIPRIYNRPELVVIDLG